ncbi:MAG TPA: hypothetical protein VHZ51_23815 [Ktedonobacteraceae bacterium]|nr:hypothetical protein [Ktedonobacteraceae bacterium]
MLPQPLLALAAFGASRQAVALSQHEVVVEYLQRLSLAWMHGQPGRLGSQQVASFE